MNRFRVALLIIILLSLATRFYRFNGPIADWHSWRQADTSSVSRIFAQEGFDILHPKYQDLSKIPTGGKDNPVGYRFVEFPIYNVAQAGLYVIFHQLTIEEWGRIVSILASMISLLLLYRLVSKYHSKTAGLFAAFFFGLVPYNIYYSRTVLPDPSMVTTLLAGIYFFDKWLDKISNLRTGNYVWFILAIVFTATAILLKPYALFFALPMLFLVLSRYGLSIIRQKVLWFFLILSVIPFIAWRLWMLQYPEGIPMSGWLLNGNHIRFKGAFFQWIFAERLGRMILGYWGLFPILIGIIAKTKKKDALFFFSFLIASLLYVFVVATGNVQHDYYQILIIPTLAIFYGLGMDFLLNESSALLNKKLAVSVALICTAFMLMFGWYAIRDNYSINHPEIVTAGRAIDKALPKDAKIIVVYGGDTTFLYQTNRKGWPVVDRSFDDFQKAGAGYIAFVNPSQSDLGFTSVYKIALQGKNYIVYDLNHPLPTKGKIVK